MIVSVFTPSHNPRYLDAAYASLRAQTHTEWEWIVLLNRKAVTWQPPEPDDRVRVERAPARLRGVGSLKRAACELAEGEILVELDHDDQLSSDCLEHVVAAFEQPETVFVYSNFAQINADGTRNDERFDPEHGWTASPVTVDGAEYDGWNSLAPTPHNVAHIWYAPNHVRAFRRSAYEQAGGFDAELEVLDDQDLMSRLYLLGEFTHIDRCLYLQRMHAANTQRDARVNATIQEQTLELYRAYIEQMAIAWAGRRGLRCLDLRTPLWIGTDASEGYEVLMVEPDAPMIEAETDSVGVIRVFDALQRLPNRVAFYNEVNRALVHAGLLLTRTPSTDGRGAFQDPSVTAFYNENSFMYLSHSELQRAVLPGLDARFQLSHLRTYFPSVAHEQADISYVEANLLAIKDGPRQGGVQFT